MYKIYIFIVFSISKFLKKEMNMIFPNVFKSLFFWGVFISDKKMVKIELFYKICVYFKIDSTVLFSLILQSQISFFYFYLSFTEFLIFFIKLNYT